MFNSYQYYFDEKYKLSKIETKFGDFIYKLEESKEYFIFKMNIKMNDHLETYLKNYINYQNNFILNLIKFEICNEFLELYFEYFDGFSLSSIINSKKEISKKNIYFIFKQWINLIELSDNQNKNGLDIKNNYILLNNKMNIKLIDNFFIKEILKFSEENDENLEVFLEDDIEFLIETDNLLKVDYNSEIFLCVEILYELINNESLNLDIYENYINIKNKNFFYKNKIDSSLKKFFFEYLELDYTKRKNINQLLKNSFYKNISNDYEEIDLKSLLFTQSIKKKFNKINKSNKENKKNELNDSTFLKFMPNFFFN